MTQKTPLYQLEYLVQGEPARLVRQVLENNSKAVEAALTAKAIPAPGAADLLQVSGRVTKIEQKARAQLYQATAQSGLAAGWNYVVLDSEDVDTHGGHQQGETGYRIPAGHGGLWLVSGSVYGVPPAGSGLLFATRLLRHPAAGGDPIVYPNVGHGDFESVTSGGQIKSMPARILTLAAGDVVYLQGQWSSGPWGTSVALTAGATSTMTLVEL